MYLELGDEVKRRLIWDLQTRESVYLSVYAASLERAFEVAPVGLTFQGPSSGDLERLGQLKNSMQDQLRFALALGLHADDSFLQLSVHEWTDVGIMVRSLCDRFEVAYVH